MIPTVALTLAGSDPSGGAGAELDLKVFTRYGVHGAAVLTCLTDQDGHGLRGLTPVPVHDALRRLELLWTLPVRAVKTGLLPGPDWIEAVGRLQLPEGTPLVVDPVLAPTLGAAVHGRAGIDAYRDWLLPRATLCTPNLPEAAALLGESEQGVRGDPEGAARRLLALGPRAVLLKGGHDEGPTVVDRLRGDGVDEDFTGARVPGPGARGTGCALSAAVAASLARGRDLRAAVASAVAFVRQALASRWNGDWGRPLLDLWSAKPD